ncbi:MAG: helix-turn-helix transcriptional regulator, partial [Saprospiraceae bacterium]
LEDKVYTEQTQETSIIHLDKNENLKGLSFLDQLYQAILKKKVLEITYQSFSARAPNVFSFHPFILKEYNNRWFLVGKKADASGVMTLALDRLLSVEEDLTTPYLEEVFDGDRYYKNTIGVTVFGDDHIQTVVLKIDRKNAPYVRTKPFHASQQILERLEDGSVIFQLELNLNLELERLLLGFGASIEVLKPRQLRRRMRWHFKRAMEVYAS